MQNNEKFWDNTNSEYSIKWENTFARRYLSKKELNFINKYIYICKPDKILDVGVGSGRIIENIIRNSISEMVIDGVDISYEMIKICKNKFKNNKSIGFLIKYDISKEKLTFSDKYNLITAIRVLKYSENWPDILKNIYENTLDKRGVLIFTMPNEKSINKFFKSPIPRYLTNINQLEKKLTNIGYRILEIKSFSKLPDFFYSNSFSNYKIYVFVIFLVEGVLSCILGDKLFGRILFIAVKKDG